MNKKTILSLSLFLILAFITNVSAITATIDKSSISVEGVTDTVYNENLTLINDNGYVVRVILTKEGSIIDKLTFENSVYFLQPHENETIFFNLSSQFSGTYNGNLNVRFEGNGQATNVSTNINFLVTGDNPPDNGDDENQTPQNVEVFVSSSELTINGNVEQIIDKTITIKNINSFPITINIDNQNSNIDVLDNNFVLQSNEEKLVRIKTTIDTIGRAEKNIIINFVSQGNIPAQSNLKLIIIGQKVLKADVAYIVKSSTGVDSYLLSEITRLGYSYETIFESNLPSKDLYEYRMVIIGNQDLVSPESISTEKHKTFIINSFDFYKKSTTNFQLGWSIAKSSTTQPAMQIVDISSPISQGIPKEFRGYSTTTSTISILKGDKPSGIKYVASTAGLSTDAVIATLEKSKRLLNGKTLEERQLFFGLTDSSHWTPETKKLFENSLKWLLDGEDRDGDTFFSDVDCNDNDFQINPDAEEIAYDGKDNDCMGGDLVDVDEDSYSSIVVGGLDCNDDDSLINPASTNLALNCINDPPLVNNIPEITLMETENALIVVNAQDPENDILTYFISDERFTNVDNTFIWSTDYESQGDYVFTVIVSDGQFTVQKDVQIEVTKYNRAPLLSFEIPQIGWGEDRFGEIDVGAYFLDEDEDSLTFGVESKTEGIIVEKTDEDSFKLTSEENWHGEGSIVFWANDGEKTTLSNPVELIVISINDPLIFKDNIENIEFRDDMTQTNIINLYDYFNDIDEDTLLFNYEKSSEGVNILINNGLVSFIPENNYFGEFTIKFTATDNEFSAESNILNVIVNPAGELPILDEFNCTTNINEDEEYNCVLTANDGDIDLEQNIALSVSNQENAVCTIQDNILTYESLINFNGDAYCEITLTDSDGETSQILNLVVSPVNDAPQILSFAPIEDVNSLIEGRTKEFSVRGKDIDSNLNIKWFVNGELKKTENKDNSNYVFSANPGFYILEARIDDSSEIVSKTWTVIIGSFSEYTCNEVGGFVLEEDQVCPQTILGVRDTNLCCSVAGTPAFKDADACELINNNIIIEIDDPSSSDDFTLGDNIDIDLDITNDLLEDKDFDIEAHLYNLDQDKSEEDESTNIEVENDRTRSVNIDLMIPNDLDLDDKYALFIKVEDNECSQIYQSLSIDRPDKNVKISEVNLPDSASCGEAVNVDIKIENLGEKDQSVKLTIENNDLKIKEESDLIMLDKFDDQDDKNTEDFQLSIPKDIESGEYEFTFKATYADRVETYKKNIDIVCNKESVTSSVIPTQKITSNEPINLNQIKKDNTSSSQKKKPNFVFFAFMITLINFILIVAILNLYSASKKKKQKRDFDIIRNNVFQMAEDYQKKPLK